MHGAGKQEKRRLAAEVVEQAGTIAELQAQLAEAREAAQSAPAAPAEAAAPALSVASQSLRLEARPLCSHLFAKPEASSPTMVATAVLTGHCACIPMVCKRQSDARSNTCTCAGKQARLAAQMALCGQVACAKCGCFTWENMHAGNAQLPSRSAIQRMSMGRFA